MAYTQAEKGDLIDRLARLGVKPKVLTVAEAQGLTFDDTVVFRSNPNKIPIYDDPSQVTTAFTRQRSTLRYYTSFSEEDLLTKWIAKANAATPADSDAVVTLSPQIDPGSVKIYAQAGMILGGPVAKPEVTSAKMEKIPRDFCSSAGRVDHSSSRVNGGILRCHNARGTTRQQSSSTPSMRIAVGGDLTSRKNSRATIATAQLRSQREKQNRVNAQKKNGLSSVESSNTRQKAATGHGIDQLNRDDTRSESGTSATQST